MSEHKRVDDTDDPELRPDGEFDRFEELARRLVRVPKSEVDAEKARRNGSTA